MKRYTWNDLFGKNGLINSLLARMERDKYKPDVIVGLARGGLIVAVTLAHRLNIHKVFSLGVASYDGHKSGELDDYQSFNEYPDGKILVVDDIADSGKSLQYAKDYLESIERFDLKFATLFWKHDCPFIPDYYVPIKHVWIVFPWEKE